jgi:hypothetical protein
MAEAIAIVKAFALDELAIADEVVSSHSATVSSHGDGFITCRSAKKHAAFGLWTLLAQFLCMTHIVSVPWKAALSCNIIFEDLKRLYGSSDNHFHGRTW